MRELNLPAANKPLFFLDTEKGSDWVARKIKDAGVELYTAKTRAFVDLLAAVEEAERNASLLLVDSVTHFWVELCAAYAKKQKRNRFYFEDRASSLCCSCAKRWRWC
jgi:AAA domain